MFAHMSYVPVIALSAKNGTGVGTLLNAALELYGQLTRKIDTAALNVALADWLAAYPPPSSGGPHCKLRYITQAGMNPVRFLIFCNRPELLPGSYESYLRNKIRSDLGFDKIPVQLEVRKSRKNWEER
jgi:GTP-binding protein